MSNNFKKKQEQERKKFKSWENPQVKDRYVRFAHNTLHNETLVSSWKTHQRIPYLQGQCHYH